jgi:hypothetical protein
VLYCADNVYFDGEMQWTQRLRDVLVPALLGPLQLCVFGPHTIYQANQSEFSAPFWSVAGHLLLPAALISASFILIGLIIPRRWFRRYVSLLFGTGILFWIQGNLFAANYLLNGDAIDWGAQDWRNPVETALWIGIPALSLLAARFIFPVAVFGSGVLAGLQALLIASTVVRGDSAGHPQWQGPSASMFEISTRQNAFHILLDGFHSDVFQEFVETERATFDQDFAGFTFFADHAGAFPTTIVSVPAMLTGTTYRNRMPLPEYRRDHFRNGSLFAALRAGGFRVDSLSELDYDSSSATNYFRVPRPYVAYDAYTAFAAWQLADLSLFRHVPHRARPWVFNDQNWRIQTWLGREYASATLTRRHHPVNGAAVLDAFTTGLHAATPAPVYKFLHVGIPHQPAALNADCAFTGLKPFRRDNYARQARCGIRRIEAFLDRLRQMGLYDSSLIVISSDHGMRFPPRRFAADRPVQGDDLSSLAGKASALLLVKPPHSSGPLRVSRAPSAITDIPATILGALKISHGLPGTSAMHLDEHTQRPRTFATYSWEHDDWAQEYFDYLDVFAIDGPLHDGRSWRLAESIYRPGADEALRARGLQEPHRSSSGVVYRWSEPQAFLHAPADAGALELTVRTIATPPQKIAVSVEGALVDEMALPAHEWRTLRYTLPSSAARRSGQWIGLKVDPPWRPRRGSRWLGVQVRDVRWYTTHPPDAR